MTRSDKQDWYRHVHYIASLHLFVVQFFLTSDDPASPLASATSTKLASSASMSLRSFCSAMILERAARIEGWKRREGGTENEPLVLQPIGS
jgi:hypothetical protein